MDAVLLSSTRDSVGESPRWDPRTGTLLWVDAEAPVLHVYHPGTGKRDDIALPHPISSLAVRASGGYVATCDDGVFALDGELGERLIDLGPHQDTCFVNDSGVDPRGRLWVGSGSEEKTGLGELRGLPGEVRRSGFDLPNGIGWSPDGQTMYLADSYRRTIFAFAYDLATGAAGAERTLYTSNDGLPDGLAVDVDGCLWVAFWGGGCVRRITPGGAVEQTITLPIPQVAAVAFGGPSMRDLFITTAAYGITGTSGPDGALFHATTDTTGRQPAPCAL